MSDSHTSATGPHQANPLPAWAHRLREMTGRVDGFFLPLEAVFLATGTRLRELHGAVSRLSGTMEAAGALLSSAEISEMRDGLAEIARNIDVMRGHRGGLASTLDQMVARTVEMAGSLTVLRRTMSQVLVLAVNAKIEASQLISTGHDFTVFTRDIARLARSGEETISSVQLELSGLRAAAAKAQALQNEFETRELPELDAVADRLSISFEAMRDSQYRAERGAREIPQRLQALFGHIANLMSDMQIYDATRQRLEHIEQALAEAAAKIEADGASGMDERQQRVFINGIADLQSLQLEHASAHYHEAVKDVGASLAAMAQGVPAVAGLCQEAFGSDGANTLLEISRNLEKAGQVFANFVTTREQAASSLDFVVKATGRAAELMHSLSSVNSNMRLMGLNAAIKCGNMGSIGRVLSVIAQELQAYATLTHEHVQAVAGHLHQTSLSAANISRSAQADSDHIDAGALKQEIDRIVLRLQHNGDALSGLTHTIGDLSESVVSQTRTAEEGFSSKAECRQALDAGVRELRALAVDSDPGLHGAALEEARRVVLAFTERQYTMASERSVHGSVVKGRAAVLASATDAAAPPSGGAAGGKEPDIDDLLF